MFKLSDYNCRLTSLDAPLCGNVKEPYKESWKDEDGDDEFCPERLFFESYDITLGIVVKESCRAASARNMALQLVMALSSDNPLLILDGNSGIGWVGARFAGCSDTEYCTMDTNKGLESVMTFSLKFKVNNPTDSVQAWEDDNGDIVALAVSDDE